MSSQVKSSSCNVMSCRVMAGLVVPCHVMSCHVMSCHVMSCHVMSCYSCYLFVFKDGPSEHFLANAWKSWRAKRMAVASGRIEASGSSSAARLRNPAALLCA